MLDGGGRRSGAIRRWGLLFGGLSLTSLVAAIFAISDFGRMRDMLSAAILPGLLLVMASVLCNMALRVGRFAFYLRRLGVVVPLGPIAVIYIAGFAMSVTPGKVGEMLRASLLNKSFGVTYRNGIAAVFADRTTDVLAMSALSIAGLGGYPEYRLPAALLVAAFLAGTFIIAHPTWIDDLLCWTYRITGRHGQKLVQVRRVARQTKALFRPVPLTLGMLVGIVGWLAECAGLWLCVHALHGNLDFIQAIFVLSFASLAGGITFLPGGLGGTEVTMVALLVSSGIPLSLAVLSTAIFRLGTLWFGVACGYCAIATTLRSTREKSIDLDLVGRNGKQRFNRTEKL